LVLEERLDVCSLNLDIKDSLNGRKKLFLLASTKLVKVEKE
jgi:hypothetical protein